MVTIKPTLPAHARCCASFSVWGGVLGELEKLSIALNSSRFHVLPMLKLPLLFSRALCILTRPVLLTATMMRRGFLLSALVLSGGGGVDGKAESSTMRICVM